MQIDTALWTILIGSLVAAACGLLGCFLVLRRLAMLGDAISHSILAGIVVAFLLTSNRGAAPMMIGAILVGLATTFLVQALSRGGVQGDAAIGVIFTSLFALGVVLVTRYAANVDLDVECVLYGDIELAPLDTLGTGPIPRAVAINGTLLAANIALLALFYKQFKICAFDPAMAAAVGIPVGLMHYLLMGMVSVTTVGAFESVGAILVVAMLIVPAATAYLLTDRLSWMLGLSVVVGVASAVSGYFLSVWLDCSVAGAMASAAGGLFALAFLFSPTHGVIFRRIARTRLRRQIAQEDVLLWAGRREEAGEAAAFTVKELSRAQEWLPSEAAKAARRLLRAGLLRRQGDYLELSESGADQARELIRRHRLYESYLGELGYAADHQHGPADRVEHHLSPSLTAEMEAAVDFPERDPQGKPIPPAAR